MKSLALLVLVALSFTACGPPTCDSQPLPEAYKELGASLPSSAVVCGPGEGSRTILLNFSETNVDKITTEMAGKLKSAGWDIDNTSVVATGYLVASKGSKSVNIIINNQKSGPHAGRVTGSVSLLDSMR